MNCAQNMFKEQRNPYRTTLLHTMHHIQGACGCGEQEASKPNLAMAGPKGNKIQLFPLPLPGDLQSTN